jgi:hypothetical protein
VKCSGFGRDRGLQVATDGAVLLPVIGKFGVHRDDRFEHVEVRGSETVEDVEVESRDSVFPGLGRPDTGIRVPALKDTVLQLSLDDLVDVEKFGDAARPLAWFLGAGEVVVPDT